MDRSIHLLKESIVKRNLLIDSLTALQTRAVKSEDLQIWAAYMCSLSDLDNEIKNRLYIALKYLPDDNKEISKVETALEMWGMTQ